MPISNKSIISQANACLNDNPTELNLTQVSAIKTSNTVYSVANTSVLPAASCNKGRWIFVEDISAYRYSDGTEWTNCYDTTCRIARTEIYGWGGNLCGTLATNNTICYSSPVQEITLSSDWLFIAPKAIANGFAIKTNGTLWEWGYNNATFPLAQNNTSGNYSSPVQEITSSTNWTYVVNNGNTMALKSDGTLWGWGNGGNGDIGNNTTGKFCSPVQEITSSTNWSKIAPNGGIKIDGSLWLWGNNFAGALAQNDRTSCLYSSPVQEITSSFWCFLDTDANATYAIKTDGTLWGVGAAGSSNNTGNVCYSSPIQEITSSVNWCLVRASGQYSASGIKSDGTLWGWGFNNNGQLGVGTVIEYSSPVQEFTSSTNWCYITRGSRISASSGVSIGIKIDGSLWVWGSNCLGGLGLNTNVAYITTPVQELSSSTGWLLSTGTESRSAMAIKNIIKGFNEP